MFEAYITLSSFASLKFNANISERRFTLYCCSTVRATQLGQGALELPEGLVRAIRRPLYGGGRIRGGPAACEAFGLEIARSFCHWVYPRDDVKLA